MRMRLRLTAALLLLSVAMNIRPGSAQFKGPVIAAEGDHFTLDGQATFLLMASYFDALDASSSAWEGDLSYAKTKGYNGVRIFPNWYADYCPNGTASAGTLIRYDGSINNVTLGTLKAFLDVASAKQMVVDVTFTRDTLLAADGRSTTSLDFPAYKTALRSVAASLAAYRNVIFDVQNEFDKNPQFTPDVARDLVSGVHSVDPARLAAASQREDDGSSAGTNARVNGFDFVALHDVRDPTTWYTPGTARARMTNVRSALQPTVKPVNYQEPMPFRSFPGGCGDQQDPTPTNAQTAAASARQHGAAAWTFHSRLSFELAGTTFQDSLGTDVEQRTEFESVSGAANAPSVCWGVNAVTVSPATLSLPSVGASGSAQVTAAPGVCASPSWTASSDAVWLHVTRSGNALAITADDNGGATRDGQIVVAGRKLSVSQAAAAPPHRKTVNDYDGDGRADLAVWRASTGTWFWTTATGPQPSVQFGNAVQFNDRPLVADMDGDGKSDLMVWRPSIGTWFWTNSSDLPAYATPRAQQWGSTSLGDIPLVGDVDGDGKSDLVVWRASTGWWYWLTSSTNFNTQNGVGVQWGSANRELGDVPLLGDVDGDGKSDPMIWRASNGTWFWLTSSSGYQAQGGKQWGGSGDIPLVTDVDGDKKADLTVWRPSNGTWYWLPSSAAYDYASASGLQWGAANDIPVVEDINGDGKSDLTVWRPADGTWYWLPSSTSGYSYPSAHGQPFGSASLGDVPLPRIR